MIIERLTPALVVAAAVAPRSAAKSPGTFAAHPGTKTFEMIKTLNLMRAIGDPRFDVGGSEDARSIMSDEFDGLDATEKAAIRATLIRCRALATKIANELRNKRPEHFVDKLSLADVHAAPALPRRCSRGPRLGLWCVGQALATEAIAECIRSGSVGEAESNIELLCLVPTPATSHWDAPFTPERIKKALA